MSELEKEIYKLKKQYDTKIKDCETLIETQRKVISENRRNDNYDDSRIMEIRINRKITQAQMQAYIQAKADIDSLLDYSPISE